MIFDSPLPDVSIPDVSITDYAFRALPIGGDRIAVIDGTTGSTTNRL